MLQSIPSGVNAGVLKYWSLGVNFADILFLMESFFTSGRKAGS